LTAEPVSLLDTPRYRDDSTNRRPSEWAFPFVLAKSLVSFTSPSRLIGRLGFVALNLASLPLVFGHLGVTLVAGSIVVGILAWYARPERATGTERAAGP
jgi:hypothetical protein